FAKAGTPGEHAIGVELAQLLVEQLVLIGKRGGEAAGMRLRQIGKHLGEKPETDQEAVQRVFVQIIATAENAVEQFAILPQVAQQQPLEVDSRLTEVFIAAR